MTTTFSTTTNPHIAALEVVLNEAKQPIEWLVIAHNDSQMLRSLAAGLNGQSAAILEISQAKWNFGEKELSETIEWALQQGEIKNLVLVGNSEGGGPERRASLAAPKATAATERGYGKLLAGVQRNIARRREAQERLAANVQQVSQIPVVHNRWSNDELAIYGLFFRADTTFFLAYDINTDAFRPAPARLVSQA